MSVEKIPAPDDTPDILGIEECGTSYCDRRELETNADTGTAQKPE